MPRTSPHRAATPRAAAIAGILFALLFGASIVLVRVSVSASLTDASVWVESNRSNVTLALVLIPFAGIAFLWFVGVLRDRLGDYEDRFFSTVTLGSALTFLALTFAAFAIAGAMLDSYQLGGNQFMTPELYVFGRALMSQIFNTYAVKMAGVFMFSLSTLWLRTSVMPRYLSFATYVLVTVMLVSYSRSLWMVLVFPVWVLIVSVFILFMSFSAKTGDRMTPVTAIDQ